MSKLFSILALLGLLLSAMNAPVYACGSGDDCTDDGDKPLEDCSEDSCS